MRMRESRSLASRETRQLCRELEDLFRLGRQPIHVAGAARSPSAAARSNCSPHPPTAAVRRSCSRTASQSISWWISSAPGWRLHGSSAWSQVDARWKSPAHPRLFADQPASVSRNRDAPQPRGLVVIFLPTSLMLPEPAGALIAHITRWRERAKGGCRATSCRS